MQQSIVTASNAPRRTIAAWALYDWANSAFATLVVTFVFATYFTQAFAPDTDTGTAWWSRAIVLSALIVAVLSPLLGALADRGGSRRRDLLLATLVCVTATSALAFVRPAGSQAVLMALVIFMVANVAFEVAMVYYNAFLPAIAAPSQIGRISGYGWALGYAGGLACLVLALFGFVGLNGTPWLPLSQEGGFHIRATNLLVAGWFVLFSLPMFLWVPDPGPKRPGIHLRAALSDLVATFRGLRRYRQIVKLLVARMVYNDGLVTVFAFGGIYAAGTYGLSPGEVIAFAIVLQVAAGLGAFAFGFFDDRLGGKATILVSLVALSLGTLVAVLGTSRAWLWVAGIIIGLFAGPNQSASRSLMGRFVPPDKRTEFFGFYAFSGKATAFLGPLLLGTLTAAFGQRVGVSAVLGFFLVGGLLIAQVNEGEGMAAARAEEPVS